MRTGIMQPYFLPYIGYFQLINAVDKYVIYNDVQYIKGGWINRNRLLLNGKDFMFNLILYGASPKKMINEISVAENPNSLLRTIQSAYGKSPQFQNIFPLMESIINFIDKKLDKYIENSLIQIAQYLNCNTEFIFSSDVKEKDGLLKGKDKVLNICSVLGATEYYNAIGGQELYNKTEFENHGIKLSFLKTQPIKYKQFKNEFIPNLSILDVLMFNSAEEVKEMLNEFELI
jgi:hypothetical protein